MIRLLSLLCLATLVAARTEAGYHPEQLAALNMLYKSTNGPAWVNQTQWNNDLFCLRFGVTCDNGRNLIALYPLKSLFLLLWRCVVVFVAATGAAESPFQFRSGFLLRPP